VTLQQPGRDDVEPLESNEGPGFEVIAGRPTPAELAAMTAVLTSMIEELEDGQRAEGLTVSAWQRSQRSIRRPLVRGAGAWRSFSG
jgi:hypothetical protein